MFKYRSNGITTIATLTLKGDPRLGFWELCSKFPSLFFRISLKISSLRSLLPKFYYHFLHAISLYIYIYIYIYILYIYISMCSHAVISLPSVLCQEYRSIMPILNFM